MRTRGTRAFHAAALLLMASAVALLAYALFTEHEEFIHTVMLLYGISAMTGGIFILSFSKWDPIDPRVAGLLPAQGTANLNALYRAMGATGNARFVPSSDGSTVSQRMPISGSHAPFRGTDGGSEISAVPLGYPLLAQLQGEYPFLVTSDERGLLWAVKKVNEEILEVAENTQVKKDGDTVRVRLNGYRLMDGCTAIRGKSIDSCTLCPCPVCSLTACMLAKGFGRPVNIEQAVADERRRSITLTFSLGDAEGFTGPN
jgi:hypothetical protein